MAKKNPSKSSDPYPDFNAGRVRNRGTENSEKQHENDLAKLDCQNDEKQR